MRTRTFALATAAVLAVATLASAAAVTLASSFVSAPSGVTTFHRPLVLPNVQISTGQPLPTARLGGPLGPTADELVHGTTVVTDELQWRALWRGLYGTPFDPTLVDFSTEFLVLVGGGALAQASFGVNTVETVDAEWANPGLFGGPLTAPPTETDGFLAVTVTTVFAGALQFPPPPSTWRVAGVAIDRADLDDVVVHRTSVFAP